MCIVMSLQQMLVIQAGKLFLFDERDAQMSLAPHTGLLLRKLFTGENIDR